MTFDRPFRWARGNELTLAVGLVAALPVIVGVVRTLHHGWLPLADNGVIVLRSWDVLTGQSPLVGQFSTATAKSVGTVYSPGPMQYWLLALPVRLFGPASAVMVMGLLNVASITGAVALARRRAGLAFMVVTAIALALVCRSVPTDVLTTPFNPTAPLIPSTLLIFLAWSVACGEYRLLPLTVLVASFAVQTHLSYVPPVLAMLSGAAVGLTLVRRRAARGGAAPGRVRPWLLAAILIAAVCWSAPLLDELVHTPGNLTLLERTFTADRATLGLHSAWNAVVHAFGVPPWWLKAHVDSPTHFFAVASSPSRPSILAFLALFGLLCLTLTQWRRSTTARAAALGLLLIGALALVAASTPSESVITLGYTMQWGSPAGMFTWLAGGLGLFGLVKEAHRRGLPRFLPNHIRTGPASVGAGVALAAVSIWAASSHSPDAQRWIYAPASTVIERIDDRVPAGRRVFLRPSTGEVGYQAYPLIVYALRRNGDRPFVTHTTVETLGDWYDVKGQRYDLSLAVIEGAAKIPAGSRVLARVPLDDGPPTVRNRMLTLVSLGGGVGESTPSNAR